MAIIEIKQSTDRNKNAIRKAEIKTIISTLLQGQTCVIELDECKIAAYRKSLNHFKDEFCRLAGCDREYSFHKTDNPNIWEIERKL